MRKQKNFLPMLLMLVILTCPWVTAAEEKASAAPRVYLGARLSADLPPLLRKHLQIDSGQGLLVENIFRGSPADKVGLDKDDILLTFDGAPLKDARTFYRSLRELNDGKTAVITLIHLGRPKEVSVTLEALDPNFPGFRLSSASNWKYPLEAEESVVVRPGRMFRKQPGEKEWVEVPLHQLQSDEAKQPEIQTQYHFRHDDGQMKFTVIIMGNPAEPNALITLKTPDKEYMVPAGHINRLPQEYQQTIRYDLQKAKQSEESGRRNPRIPLQMDVSKLPGPAPSVESNLQPVSEVDALKNQIRQMEERQKELEVLLRQKVKE
jgi:hypothetical protein